MKKEKNLNPNTIYVGAKAAQRIISEFRDIFPDAIEIHCPDAPSPTGNPADDDRYFSAEYLLSNIAFLFNQAGVLRGKLEYDGGNGQTKTFALNKPGVHGYEAVKRADKAVALLMNGAAIVATATSGKAPAKAKKTRKK